ncbi:hypothetical protein BK011_05530 [Tenericutes bacterium MZ-XQ]|nr:hypothetical protein BK011_05530 [Tenericutes bacterium MZ-XQ]
MQHKIIFVEGQPGSGKSTISQFITQQLNLNGESVYWLDEYEHDGGYFNQFWEDYDQPNKNQVETLIKCWRHLIDKIKESDSTFIIDSAYLSYTLYLLNLEISFEKIKDYFQSLNRLLSELNPKVIFFKGDTKTIITRACERRGDIWTEYTIEKIEEGPYQKHRNRTGFEGMVAYFSDAQNLYADLLPLSDYQILQLDVTEENWPKNEEMILAWLGYPRINNTHELSKSDLKKYLGMYQVPDHFPAKGETLQIVEKDDLLILVGKFWNDYKLIPKSNTHFLISGIPMELNFNIQKEGTIAGFDYTFIDGKTYFCVKTNANLVR